MATAPEPKISSREDLEGWLKDKPDEWAQAIAARAALRVLPVMLWGADGQGRENLILQSFRASFISWAACKYPASDMAHAAAAAATASNAAAVVASNIASISASDAVASVAYAPAASNAVAAVANAATAAAGTNDLAAEQQLWEAVGYDCRWLADKAKKVDTAALIEQSLWPQIDTGFSVLSDMSRRSYREWLSEWRALTGSQSYSFAVIFSWFVTASRHRTRGKTLFSRGVVIEVATQSDQFWTITDERSAERILEEIAGIVGWGLQEDIVSNVTMREFIVGLLEETKKPHDLGEIFNRVKSAGYSSVRDSVRGRVNELTYSGEIQRVGRGLYASNNWHGSLNRQPPTPEPGPGPQYGIRDSRLAVLASPPQNEEKAGQEKLLARLRRDLDALTDLAKPVGNVHPHLVRTIAEYGQLLSADIDELDVTGVWAVGSSLAGYAQAFREQNVQRTLSEPLEPQMDGLLQSVLRQHGALILGFEEGRELVSRSDEFAVDHDRLRSLEEPGNELLDQIAENGDLVDDVTRALHAPIRDYLRDMGWGANRVGYSGYLVVRNSVRAVIHFTLGRDPTVAVLVGALAGGSALLGDPNMEFLRAALPFLRENAAQLSAFFAHSLEMRAYVEWALSIIEEVAAPSDHHA